MNLKLAAYRRLVTIIWVAFCTSPAVGDEHGAQKSSLEECQNIYKNLTLGDRVRFKDASGKPGSGIFGGNTLWYGSYSECEKLPNSRYCLAMFPGSMSLIKKKPAEDYHFEWGVCLPDVCTEEDVKKDFLFFFTNVSNINNVKPSTNRLLVNCAEDPEYTASVVMTIVFCGILIGLCLVATFLEVLKSYKTLDASEVAHQNGGMHISMDQDENEKTPLLSDRATTVERKEGLLSEIFDSFSITRNVKSIMKTTVGKNELTYLHGIRVLSLFWIIIFHVNYWSSYSYWPIDNLDDNVRRQRQLLSMITLSTCGVDTFFVLSGLLVMYTNIVKRKKNNEKTNWFKYYLHRFWRLTPTYMFCILLIANLRPLLGAGPVWYFMADTSWCTHHWWTNLLYVNNFVHDTEGCLPHSWYLSADMQFFVISPLFLLIASRYGLRLLIRVVSIFILGSMIVTASLVAHYETNLVLLGFLRFETFFSDKTDDALSPPNGFNKVYFKPYCRIPPYITGIVLGYVLHKHFTKDFKLNWKFVSLMWICATALALTDIFAPYSSIKEDPHVWTTGEKAVFWALRYFIWGLCIVWLIFACHYNYAGWIKDILAAKFWIPLSHINYAAYIIHLDVINVLIYNIETPIHFTSFTLVTYFLASPVLTYCIAFLITAVVELPSANLEALIWRKLGIK